MTRDIRMVAVGMTAGVAATVFCFVGLPGVMQLSASQKPAASAASTKIVLENARVRVKDVTFAPGTSPMHKHELAHVGVVIQGGTLVFKYPDGKTETAKLDAGGVGYRDAGVSHEPTNPGKTPVRVIEVELK